MKKLVAVVAFISLLLLTSCSAGNENAISDSAVTSKSETTQPPESVESEKDSSNETPQSSESTESEKAASSPKVKPTKKTTDVSKTENSAEEVKPGNYLTLLDYEGSKEKYAASNVVLFFNASWCSTCKIARDNIESSLASIPSNLVIVVVDFDSETELRKKYGVTIQHTFVQVDKNGSQLAKWAGSVTVKQIAEKIV